MSARLYYLLAPVILIYVVRRWLQRSPIANIRGPRPEFLFGNGRHVLQRSNIDAMIS
ncbi:hypothetical protein NEOLEDRAFT_1130999 [Neolentinus lepideus HHB14362 ss-1]|uniref:Uncharacterized protein n=1 Tax=Neolentinus lepideus HHB14362 ss-1 TaxID=1314782 RepID=A0A165U056_9AGAM|nr:hypothetical protein NEOLEDRAFT_1130999 [Neolentinus lepideus HHB14362 ss-1]